MSKKVSGVMLHSVFQYIAFKVDMLVVASFDNGGSMQSQRNIDSCIVIGTNTLETEATLARWQDDRLVCKKPGYVW